ncbi:5-methylcytosine-specific restriction endonuclease McrA [Streptomyces zhaozhouensis]|uniref:5-methylcytosine-specific restriction endonuclease McrA n=1 Tax=Streptomyces zhaozhouensis TaxID=1300267 RepID=A0A286E5U4_9ACTN|nr:HNH endonuclease [Streptomyces zhaozhouensis]SOD66308.1 5-methylcytosine-specific restriction endonuclease McrA [Streptomyces zhaozhouensis]
MPHVLVLNASYEPLGVVPVRRALILLLNDKAVSLETSGSLMRSASRAIPAPSVVRLKRFVRVPYRTAVPLTRRALFARDGGRCAYCGGVATSVDHVIPRSRGGQHAWDNVVAACRSCNHIKADRHVAELGWRLRHTPGPPSGLAWRIIGTGHRDPRWLPYLRPYGADDALARIEARPNRAARPAKQGKPAKPGRQGRGAALTPLAAEPAEPV